MGRPSEEVTLGRIVALAMIAEIADRHICRSHLEKFVDELLQVGLDDTVYARREAAFTCGSLAKLSPLPILLNQLVCRAS